MPLEILKKSDTWKGLDKPIKVKEQKLVTSKRDGFTVVEWVGTEIK